MSKNIITTSSSSPPKNDSNDEGQGIVGRIKKIRHKEFLIAGLAVLIMLILYFATCSSSLGSSGSANQDSGYTPQENECRLRRVERRLTEAIVSINGVSSAQVIINWESTMEIIIANTNQTSQNSTSQTPVLTQGGGQSRPIIIQEIYPNIIGVLIVADGVQDPRIRFEITNAVVTLLNVRPAQVAVLAM
ncbi:MAG: hypothetical protein FWE22_03015 [Firmicutes bacterium]|nr:hypothetical protein [Bacillota bacterium]